MKRSSYLFCLGLAGGIGILAMSSSEAKADLWGTPDEDPTTAQLRNAFQNARTTVTAEDLHVGKTWICSSHQAFRGGDLTSNSTLTFNVAGALIQNIADYPVKIFSQGQQGLYGRYSSYGQASHVWTRVAADGSLVFEVSIALRSAYEARDYVSALANPSLGAGLYGVCTLQPSAT